MWEGGFSAGGREGEWEKAGGRRTRVISSRVVVGD